MFAPMSHCSLFIRLGRLEFLTLRENDHTVMSLRMIRKIKKKKPEKTLW